MSWSQWIRSPSIGSPSRAAGAALLAFGLFSGANAAGSGCDAFQWPLETEKAAFASPSIESVASGASRGPWKQQAFVFKLQPVDAVSFVTKPGGKEGKDAHGGLLTFDAPEAAGSYQVTLSDEGWVDVVQGGAPLKSTAHTGAKDCPGLRKSVRFAVAKGPVVLQVSAVKGDEIKVAITPAQ